MSRKLVKTLPFLATALILLLGFSLPGLVSAAQDKKLAAQLEHVSSEAAPQDIGFFDRMRYYGSGYIPVNLGSLAVEVSESADDAALKVASRFLDCLLGSKEGRSLEVRSSSCILAVSYDGLQTSSMWEYSISDDIGSTVNLQLDAQSEKLVQLYYSPPKGLSSSLINIERTDEIAQTWADFCADYYGLKFVSIRKPQESDDVNRAYLLTFEETGGQTVNAYLILQSISTYFSFTF